MVKHEKAVDVKKALQYPLLPVPLSIATADGSKRGTKKINLLLIIKDKMINENIKIQIQIPTQRFSLHCRLYGFFKNTQGHSINIRGHAIKQIPTGYNRADIVADTYRPVSIKMQERDGRGRSNCIIINSVKSRTPCDFKEFLSNGENKSKLITLYF